MSEPRRLRRRVQGAAYGALVNRTWGRRLIMSALDARCRLIGHRHGKHFTDMGLASPGDNEAPWCDRCGRDQTRSARKVTR